MFKVSYGNSLNRYYLLKLFGCGIFLHKIHSDDPPGIYHNHPWNWFSIVIGQYWETKWDDGNVVSDRVYGFNSGKAEVYHRIIVDSPVWTIFFHGPKCNKWKIIDSLGTVLKVEPFEGPGQRRSYID